jgi:cytochrome c oxidase assembly factor CtaG
MTSVFPSRAARMALLLAGGIVAALAFATALAWDHRGYTMIARPVPGSFTTLGTMTLRIGADVASLITVGSIVSVLLLHPVTRADDLRVRDRFYRVTMQLSSGAWAACAGLLVAFEAADSNGIAVTKLVQPHAFVNLYSSSDYPRAWQVSFLAAASIFVCSFMLVRWTHALAPLALSLVAVLAPVVVGPVLVGPDHDVGGDSAVYQTLAINIVLGAVVVQCLRAAAGRVVHDVSLRRLVRLGLIGLPVVAIAEIVLLRVKLAGSPLLGSATGWFGLSRLLCVAVLAGLLWWLHSTLRSGRPSRVGVGTWLEIAALVVGAFVACQVAQTRVPPPVFFVETSINETLLGFDYTRGPGVGAFLTQWRPNVLFLVLGATAVWVYLLAVRTLRRRGDRWATGRTVSWILGWLVVVGVTSSGLGRYASADFGVHMAVHMCLNMLGPLLLVMGGFVTLIQRAAAAHPQHSPSGPHEWIVALMGWPMLRRLYNPLLVFVVFVGSYYVLYLTPLFGTMMKFHWAHQLMNLHFLVIGYLYYGMLVGVDRMPREVPHVAKLGLVLAAMPFHAFFGVIIMSSNRIVADMFYRELELPWTIDLPRSQYVGGGVAWAGGEIPLLIVIIVLAAQWARQDRIEATRTDRHLDSGLDDSWDSYNEMLQKLSERDADGAEGGRWRR